MPYNKPSIDRIIELSKDADLQLDIDDFLKPGTKWNAAEDLRKRLQTLVFKFTGPVDIAFYRYFRAEDTFLNLESLQLSGHGPFGLDHKLHHTIKFPKLGHLSLVNMMLQQGIHAEQLISLEISDPKTDQFADYLHDLLDGRPRIQSIVIGGFQSHNIHLPTPQLAANLPDLNKLVIKFVFATGLADILDCLNAPHLETIVLNDVVDCPSYAYDSANDEIADNEEANDPALMDVPDTVGTFFRHQIRRTVRCSIPLFKSTTSSASDPLSVHA